jgi:putative ABC transport system permease protein
MTATEAFDAPDAPRQATLPRMFRLALRELRGGLSGFYIFIACLALGVMVITAVGALSDALKHGFQEQGEMILGGDITLARMHARATAPERASIGALGRVSETAAMRAMARLPDGSEQALVEIKGVDASYPLVGQVEVESGKPFAEAMQSGGIVADPVLLERLGVKPGDLVKIGEAEIPVAAVLKSEPDGLADRMTYGPRVFLSLATLEKTKLIQPGTLIKWRYAVKRPADADRSDAALKRARDEIKAALPESGYTIVDRRDPSPQVTKTLERLRQFLTLIGLTSLLVGGVGVANAVATFIDRRRKVIATMKSLGATSRFVFAVFLTQILAVTAIGVAIGLVLGVVVPNVLMRFYGDLLPVQPEFDLSATSLVVAALYGVLVSLLFTLWPLGRAQTVSPSVLFREEVAPERRLPPTRIIIATVAIAAALVLVAVATSDSKRIALYFSGGLIVVFAVFLALGEAVTRLAQRIRRPRIPEVALAIGNIGAPGGLTRAVVLSLGAGLSLLVAVALANSSMLYELQARLPADAPSYFVLDIPKGEYAGLRDLVEQQVPGARLEEAPMLRGRLIRLADTPVEQVKAPPEAQWVLNGDRGLTYSDTVPEGSHVTEGRWWDKGYQGEPLVSFEAELARQLGLKIGDSVTVNVLGRNVSAKIANLRDVKWESLALNFVMVFSPNTLAGAPHNLLATITLPKAASTEDEVRMARALGKAYPSVSAIRVKDAINAFSAIFEKVMTAVRVAGGVTLLAGAFVLAGALATAQRRRILEAVILKTLGATRWRLIRAHMTEYLTLAAITAVFAVVLGSIAAWFVVSEVMRIEFAFSWAAVAGALGLSLALVALFGGLGTWAVLRAPAVPYLKAE